jgi:hypothetical protein
MFEVVLSKKPLLSHRMPKPTEISKVAKNMPLLISPPLL